MKIGQKEIAIIFLVGIICLLAGVLIAQKSSPEPSIYQQPADDGKLSKSYKEENLVAKIREKGKEVPIIAEPSTFIVTTLVFLKSQRFFLSLPLTQFLLNGIRQAERP